MVRAMYGQKVVDRKMTDEHVGVEENYRLVSNSEWSWMVWTCAKQG